MARPKKENEKKWRETFLRALAQEGNVGKAARIAGISRSGVYAARKRAENNPEDNFDELWALAEEAGLDMLEEILVEIGKGERKGNVTAIIYMLNNKRYQKAVDPNQPRKITFEWIGANDGAS